MKKVLFCAALCFAAASIISCDKENSNDVPDMPNEVKRVTVMATNDKGDGYVFEYNADGTVKCVSERWGTGTSEEGTYAVNFSYDGKKVKLVEEKIEFTIGDNGYAKNFIKEGVEYTLTYNEACQLTKIAGNGKEFTMTYENGNLVKLTRVNDEEGLQTKIQTYNLNQKNLSGIFTIYNENAPIKRWMYETGFFGKSSVNLCQETKWQHLEMGATYEYDMDDFGYVTAEHKFWDGTPDADFFYTWEVVK